MTKEKIEQSKVNVVMEREMIRECENHQRMNDN